MGKKMNERRVLLCRLAFFSFSSILPSSFTVHVLPRFAWLRRKIVSIIDITFGIKFAFQSNSLENFCFEKLSSYFPAWLKACKSLFWLCQVFFLLVGFASEKNNENIFWVKKKTQLFQNIKALHLKLPVKWMKKLEEKNQ